MITIIVVGVGGFILGLVASKVMAKPAVKVTDAEVKKDSDEEKKS